ncbi:ferritin-like domain-containing protein [Deminuibacter soli]|uniref:Ferritin-like domain-containing protein n=2 Tax=Deminuibacter soli TaxID=2291815 RepID=A0A3E1NRR4_9BACT|nr:ferritin-like domain-containing protein [Deminuibacter soli]
MYAAEEQAKGKPASVPRFSASRRNFLLKTGGISFASALVLAASGCTDNDAPNGGSLTPPNTTAIDLGSGDTGILNYAYALEQLEAAFYTQVIATPYSGISDAEKALLTDIRDHEVAHREFFKTALGSKAIVALKVNFSSINFSDRTSVLGTAKAFEDLGVSAYNGAGHLISSPDYLTLAGKIVSVEARHAAYIRDLITPGSFSSNVDSNGLDISAAPTDVLKTAQTFLTSKLDGSHLPS